MCPSVSGQNYWRSRYNNRDSGVCLDMDASAPAMHNVAPDRWYLYLPRSLSYCEECRRELEEHVRRKAKLLDDYLQKYHPEMLGSGVFRPAPVEYLRKRTVFHPSVPHDVTFYLDRRDSSTSVESTAVSECSGSSGIESAGSDADRHKLLSKARTMPGLMEEPSSISTGSRSCLVKKQTYRSVDSWLRGSVDEDDDEHIRRRKTVRFADAIGLELEHVRFLMRPNQLDKNARLTSKDKSITSLIGGSICLNNFDDFNLRFVPQFIIPRLQLPFSPERGSVYLEQLILPADWSSPISGRVRVENLDFEKKVSVRYTIDDWKTQCERPAQYMLSYGDGRSDAFRFTFFLNRTQIVSGLRLQFAICCEFPTVGQLYWDNNKGKNYSILVHYAPLYRSHATHDLSHAL